MKMRTEFLPFSPPCVGEEEIQEVVNTLRSAWITTGPKTRQFESDFGAYLSAPGTLALNSCTAGLHVALVTLGIGPGDEVITTPMTFAATVNVIEHVGARPVLVDVEPDTLNIDPSRVERAISSRTKAIIPVHFAGHPAELEALRTLTETRHLHLIEDAAHALPAKYKGEWIGSQSNPTVFSFYATKNLTTAEGGMLTGTPDFIERSRMVSLHGMNRDAYKRYDKAGSWFYEVVLPGFKYNMTDIQASLGLWQLRKLQAFQDRRMAIVRRYQEAFQDHPAFQLPVSKPWVEHAWHLYVLRINPDALTIDRARFIEELKDRNIGTSVHFIPVHLHPYYREKYRFERQAFPVALDNFERAISLPLNPAMKDQDVSDVIESVLDVGKTFRR